MNTKYFAIIFGSFFIINSVFIYIYILGDWNFFIDKMKWFMRYTAPFLIIYLFILGTKDK